MADRRRLGATILTFFDSLRPLRLCGLVIGFLCVLLLVTPSTGFATDLDGLLTAPQAPPGVVFEIVSGDPTLLQTLLPALRADIERLRGRFPGLPVAIVTHGNEQFALTKDKQAQTPELHSLARDLVTEDQVALHVCGTYAQWNGFDTEDFPEHVNVAAAGPAQINDYRALDYVVITLP